MAAAQPPPPPPAAVRMPLPVHGDVHTLINTHEYLMTGQKMTTNELGFPNKNRVAILAELDKEKRKLLLQNQSSTNNPGASIALARPNVNKDFRDRAEQQHIAAQQKAALQVWCTKLWGHNRVQKAQAFCIKESCTLMKN